MANTYTQLLVHVVFSVKFRERLIKESFRIILEKYICGIISNKDCKPLAIYCNPDHCHILIGLNPSVSISHLMQSVKANSTEFIKRNFWTGGHFAWQGGYGAFSVDRDRMGIVVRYILNQPNHHRKRTFQEEYQNMLKAYEIEFDEKYLFEFF